VPDARTLFALRCRRTLSDVIPGMLRDGGLRSVTAERRRRTALLLAVVVALVDCAAATVGNSRVTVFNSSGAAERLHIAYPATANLTANNVNCGGGGDAVAFFVFAPYNPATPASAPPLVAASCASLVAFRTGSAAGDSWTFQTASTMLVLHRRCNAVIWAGFNGTGAFEARHRHTAPSGATVVFDRFYEVTYWDNRACTRAPSTAPPNTSAPPTAAATPVPAAADNNGGTVITSDTYKMAAVVAVALCFVVGVGLFFRRRRRARDARAAASSDLQQQMQRYDSAAERQAGV
jgi:hypothetical protein